MAQNVAGSNPVIHPIFVLGSPFSYTMKHGVFLFRDTNRGKIVESIEDPQNSLAAHYNAGPEEILSIQNTVVPAADGKHQGGPQKSYGVSR